MTFLPSRIRAQTSVTIPADLPFLQSWHLCSTGMAGGYLYIAIGVWGIFLAESMYLEFFAPSSPHLNVTPRYELYYRCEYTHSIGEASACWHL